MYFVRKFLNRYLAVWHLSKNSRDDIALGLSDSRRAGEVGNKLLGYRVPSGELFKYRCGDIGKSGIDRWYGRLLNMRICNRSGK